MRNTYCKTVKAARQQNTFRCALVGYHHKRQLLELAVGGERCHGGLDFIENFVLIFGPTFLDSTGCLGTMTDPDRMLSLIS
jgi:hypothetical protein